MDPASPLRCVRDDGNSTRIPDMPSNFPRAASRKSPRALSHRQHKEKHMGHYLIIGGSGGIGSALARLLKAEGHTLHLTGRDADRLTAMASELGATSTVGDVLDEGFAAKVATEAGPVLDGLAYCAGTINLKPLARLTVEDFHRDYAINALGAVQTIQAAMPALKAASGTASILLFSSIAVAQGFVSHASISMAKGAIEGLTRALSAELAPKIRVNAIAPSLTDTPLAKAITGNAAIAQGVAALHAIPRLGEADDIAAMGALLLSDKSSWITGQVIAIDGGRSRARTKG
jgi:NAD(P)-dependent dehydrogenase (short-subunit alcohol dehydrogenase family)